MVWVCGLACLGASFPLNDPGDPPGGGGSGGVANWTLSVSTAGVGQNGNVTCSGVGQTNEPYTIDIHLDRLPGIQTQALGTVSPNRNYTNLAGAPNGGWIDDDNYSGYTKVSKNGVSTTVASTKNSFQVDWN